MWERDGEYRYGNGKARGCQAAADPAFTPPAARAIFGRMGYEETILGRSEVDYGDQYESHVLAQYQMYVGMADRISARRQTANSFFLPINTALVGLVGDLSLGRTQPGVDSFVAVGLAGMVLCYLWYRIIRSYRDLNTAKFKVVHEMEKLLPLRPYDAEWDAVGRGKDANLYKPFTHVEIAVPWVFFTLHLLLVVRGLVVGGLLS